VSREYRLQSFRPPIDLKIDYAKELNPQQLAAVTSAPGPALVIAGAGSGKTRTLTYRVAFLLEQGIPADRILLLTFTNKAAAEMMRRVSDLLGGDLANLWGGTFHSIGNRILRRHADRLGYRHDFTILDREDAKDLVQACVDDAQIDVATTRFPKADLLLEVFSLAANTQKTLGDLVNEQFSHFAELTETLAGLWRRYGERKRTSNLMDFDDLLVFWLKLLQDNPDLAELYQRRFQFILVDEYQDTNRLQSDLIDLLAARHHQLMVVGDDSQSIYSWRGAHFKNILDFPTRYPGAVIYRIETNYRSTPEILEVANAVIAANVHQFPKHLTASRKSGTKPVLVSCGSGGEQAQFIAQRVLELRDEGTNLNEMAVLYRSHFHALELQLELTRHNIPFSITSGIRFFEQAHIKDVLAHLKLVYNPLDELSFKRAIRLLPGIGGKTADKLWRGFQDQVSQNAPAEEQRHSLARGLQTCAASVPKKSAVAWAQFAATMAQLEERPVRGDSRRMIELLLEAIYQEYLEETYANYANRLEEVHQLAEFSTQFEEAEKFLSELALLTHIDAEGDRSNDDETDRLRLSTIHQAKGLEFAVVFVIMLCDGLFPSARSIDNPANIEEERRLFYVAVTRAKTELYLSYPMLRTTAGQMDVMQRPSRFLHEIPSERIEEWKLRSW